MIKDKIIAIFFVLCLTLSIFISMIDNVEGVVVDTIVYEEVWYSGNYQMVMEHELLSEDNPDITVIPLEILNTGIDDIVRFSWMPIKYLLDDFANPTLYNTDNFAMSCSHSSPSGIEIPFTTSGSGYNRAYIDITPISTGESFIIYIYGYDIENYITTIGNYHASGEIFVYNFEGNQAVFNTVSLAYNLLDAQYEFTKTYSEGSELTFPDVGIGDNDIHTSNYAIIDEVTGNGYDIGTIDFSLITNGDFTPDTELTGFKIANNGAFRYSFDNGVSWNTAIITSNGVINTITCPSETISFWFKLFISTITSNAEEGINSLSYNLQLHTNPTFVFSGGTRGFTPTPSHALSVRTVWGDESGIYGNVEDYLNTFETPTGEYPREPSLLINNNYIDVIENNEREHYLYFIFTLYDVFIHMDYLQFIVNDYFIAEFSNENYFESISWVSSQDYLLGTYYSGTYELNNCYIYLNLNGVESNFRFGQDYIYEEQSYTTLDMLNNEVSTYFDFTYVSHKYVMDSDYIIYNYNVEFIPLIIEPIGITIDDYLYDIYTPEGRDSFWVFSVMITMVAFVFIFAKKKKK